ncbi:hypothetical protein EXW58_28395 (plasmid) [Bacillus mycoides]|nr:hypothetical protein EXW58_28395 [Bacillus mycoides]
MLYSPVFYFCTRILFLYILIKKRRLTPTDIHLPPKIDVSHLHIFEEAVFCRKTIKFYYFL